MDETPALRFRWISRFMRAPVNLLLSWILVTSALPFALPKADASAPAPFTIDRVEGSTVTFRTLAPEAAAPPPLVTTLHDLKALGIFSGTTPPYLLAVGRPCAGCASEPFVYLIALKGGKATPFTYPGRLIEPTKNTVSLESRAFYGRCLPNRGEVFVAFQKERIEKKHRLRTELSVFVAEPKGDFVHEELLVKHFPALSTVTSHVRARTCWEIEGKHRVTQGPKIDLRIGAEAKDDEEEDDGVTEKAGQDSPDASASPRPL